MIILIFYKNAYLYFLKWNRYNVKMNQELYFLRSTEQYLAKELLLYAVHLDEKETNLDGYAGLEQYQQHFGSYNGDIGVYILAGEHGLGY